MQCVCGVTNAEGAKFCSACGRKLEAAKRVCAACGAENAPDAKFCSHCGKALGQAAPLPSDEATPELKPAGRVAGVGGWELNWAWRPIPHMAAAQAMSKVGAVACAIVAVVMTVVGFQVLGANSLIGVGQFAFAAIYATCALGLWHGAPLAGWVAVPLYLFNVLAGLKMLAASGAGGPGHPFGSTGVVVLIGIYVAAPLALICGLRGALAWGRFRRAATG